MVIGEGAELALVKSTKTSKTVAWACRSAESTDFRCASNWFMDEEWKVAAKSTPTAADDIVFSAAISSVDNTPLPLVKSVKVGADSYSGKKFGQIPEGLFTRPFLDPSRRTSWDAWDNAAKSSCMNETSHYADYKNYLEERMAIIENLMIVKDTLVAVEDVSKIEDKDYVKGQDFEVSMVLVDSPDSAINPLAEKADEKEQLQFLEDELTDKFKTRLDALAEAEEERSVWYKDVKVTYEDCEFVEVANTQCPGNVSVFVPVATSTVSGSYGKCVAAPHRHATCNAVVRGAKIPKSSFGSLKMAMEKMPALWVGGVKRAGEFKDDSSITLHINLFDAAADYLAGAALDGAQQREEAVAYLGTRNVAELLGNPTYNDATFDRHLHMLRAFGTKATGVQGTKKKKNNHFGGDQDSTNPSKYSGSIGAALGEVLSEVLPFPVVDPQKTRIFLGSKDNGVKNFGPVPHLVVKGFKLQWFMDNRELTKPFVDVAAVGRKVAGVLLYEALQLELDQVKRKLFDHIETTTTTVYTATVMTDRPEYEAEPTFNDTEGGTAAEQLTRLKKNYKTMNKYFDNKVKFLRQQQVDRDASLAEAVADARKANEAFDECVTAESAKKVGGKKVYDYVSQAEAACGELKAAANIAGAESKALLDVYAKNTAATSSGIGKTTKDKAKGMAAFAKDVEQLLADIPAADKGTAAAAAAGEQASKLLAEVDIDMAELVSSLTNASDASAATIKKEQKRLAENLETAQAAEDKCISDRENVLKDEIKVAPGYPAEEVAKELTKRAIVHCSSAIAARMHAKALSDDAKAAQPKITTPFGSIDEVAALKESIETRKDQFDTQNSAVKVQKKSIEAAVVKSEEDEAARLKAIEDAKDDDGFPLLLIVAALLICCVIAIVVATVMFVGGGSSAKKHDPSNIAFENPVYAGEQPYGGGYDAQQAAYGAPQAAYGAGYDQSGYDQSGYEQEGMYGATPEGQGQMMPEAAAEEAGTLYDEPEMYSQEEPAANGLTGGGYLDVQPDEEDDDDEDEDDEEDEDEDEDEDEEEDEDEDEEDDGGGGGDDNDNDNDNDEEEEENEDEDEDDDDEEDEEEDDDEEDDE